MTATVILRAQAKPDKLDELKTFIAKCLPETRSYKGCINIDIFEETCQKGNFIFYENWDSFESYEVYLEYRTKQGVMDEIGSMLIGAPEITYYGRVDI